MKKTRESRPAFRLAVVAALSLGLVGVGAPQLREVVKILGVGAAVKQFGPDINKGMNKLTGHKDSSASYTKVVPIITVGLNSRGAIGAAQVMGARRNVDRVRAVASPQAELFGKEIMLRALIPVDTDDPTKMAKLKPVDGVGVSGIVDLKL